MCTLLHDLSSALLCIFSSYSHSEGLGSIYCNSHCKNENPAIIGPVSGRATNPNPHLPVPEPALFSPTCDCANSCAHVFSDFLHLYIHLYCMYLMEWFSPWNPQVEQGGEGKEMFLSHLKMCVGFQVFVCRETLNQRFFWVYRNIWLKKFRKHWFKACLSHLLCSIKSQDHSNFLSQIKTKSTKHRWIQIG